MSSSTTGGWTGPVALAPLAVRHQMKTNALKRIEYLHQRARQDAEEQAKRLQQQEQPDAAFAMSTASLDNNNNNNENKKSDEFLEPSLEKNEEQEEEEEDEDDDEMMANASTTTDIFFGGLHANTAKNKSNTSSTHLRGYNLNKNDRVALAYLSQPQPQNQTPTIGVLASSWSRKDTKKNTNNINVENNNISATTTTCTSQWNSSDQTAQTMLSDHVDRFIQKIEPGDDGDAHQQDDFHRRLKFSTVRDPLQSFLASRIHNLPFQVSNARIRRQLLIDADRKLYGKNAGSVFLLGPEAAAARDKARDAERLADPAFGFVEGIEFIESDEDGDDYNSNNGGGGDGFSDTMSLGDGLESLIDGAGNSAAGSEGRRKSSAAWKRQSFIDNFLGKSSGDKKSSTGIVSFEEQQRIKREAVLPKYLTASWVKAQTRIMVAGILFGLDSTFGERKAGDKSFERSNRIRGLFQRNDALNDVISQCVAVMFGAIGSILSAEDIVLTLSSELNEWPQLLSDYNVNNNNSNGETTVSKNDHNNYSSNNSGSTTPRMSNSHNSQTNKQSNNNSHNNSRSLEDQSARVLSNNSSAVLLPPPSNHHRTNPQNSSNNNTNTNKSSGRDSSSDVPKTRSPSASTRTHHTSHNNNNNNNSRGMTPSESRNISTSLDLAFLNQLQDQNHSLDHIHQVEIKNSNFHDTEKKTPRSGVIKIRNNDDIRKLYGLDENTVAISIPSKSKLNISTSGRGGASGFDFAAMFGGSANNGRNNNNNNTKAIPMDAEINNTSFGASMMEREGFSPEEIQRQADHEALVHALEKRFGLGASGGQVAKIYLPNNNNSNGKKSGDGDDDHDANKFAVLDCRMNPIQAACDRAGIWYSMSQPRAPSAPAHVSLSGRMTTYVSSDIGGKSSNNGDRGNAAAQKQIVLGFGVPPESDWPQLKRRNAMLELAGSFAATLRSFLDRARNPQFFREASQSLASVVATASCRIFDDIRSRAFKEMAKLKKRATLQQIANTTKQDLLNAALNRNGNDDDNSNNNNASSSLKTQPSSTKFVSASDVNRQLREHWTTSTKAVHRHLLQCRRELVYLLSGVDTYKPTYRPRAGEELIPTKQVRAASASASSLHKNNNKGEKNGDDDANRSNSNNTTLEVKRTIIPAWGEGLVLLKRHPRLQWMLKLSEHEVDTQSEKYTLPTRNAKSGKKKNDGTTTSNDESESEDNNNNNAGNSSLTKKGKGNGKNNNSNDDSSTNLSNQQPEGWFLKKATEAKNAKQQQSKNSDKTTGSGRNSPNEELDRRSPPGSNNNSGRNSPTVSTPMNNSNMQPRKENSPPTTSTTTKTRSPPNAHRSESSSLPPSSTSSSQAKKISPRNFEQVKKRIDNGRKDAQDNDDDDEERYKKAVTFIQDSLILKTGAHSGQIESLTGEKRLRTPLLSWQKMEDGTTTVKKCDVSTLQRVVANDLRAKKANGGGGGGSGGDDGSPNAPSLVSTSGSPRRLSDGRSLSRADSMTSAFDGGHGGGSFMGSFYSTGSFSQTHGGSFAVGRNARGGSVSSFKMSDSFRDGGAGEDSFRAGGDSFRGGSHAKLGSFLRDGNTKNSSEIQHQQQQQQQQHLSPSSLQLLQQEGSVGGHELENNENNSPSPQLHQQQQQQINEGENTHYIPPFATYSREHAGTFFSLKSNLKKTTNNETNATTLASGVFERAATARKAATLNNNVKAPQSPTTGPLLLPNNNNNNPNEPQSGLDLDSSPSVKSPTSKGVKFGRLPITAKSHRRKLFGDTSDLQPRNLRFALRAILHNVTENAAELHAAAVEAAQDSKSMHRQRSDLRSIRQQQQQQQQQSAAGAGTQSGGAPETEPIAVVADSIARTYQKIRQHAREQEQQNEHNAERQAERKQRWNLRQMERRFGAEEGILSVDGGTDFAIAVRKSDFAFEEGRKKKLKSTNVTMLDEFMAKLEEKEKNPLDDKNSNNNNNNNANDDNDNDDNDEQQDIEDPFKKPPSVWDEPDLPHPFLLNPASYNNSTNKQQQTPQKLATQGEENNQDPASPSSSKSGKDAHRLNTDKQIPILRNVIQNVPASRAALIHAYVQARSDSFSNRTRGDRQLTGGSCGVDPQTLYGEAGNLRSSVDNRRVDNAIKRYEAKRAAEFEARIQRGQHEDRIPMSSRGNPEETRDQEKTKSSTSGALSSPPKTARPPTSTSTSENIQKSTTPRIPPASASTSAPILQNQQMQKKISSATASDKNAKAPPSTTSNPSSFVPAPPPSVPSPWYAQGLPRHRKSLVDQREAPFGRFHLAQGSPLLTIGMHSKNNVTFGEGTKKNTGGDIVDGESMHHKAGRRDVKWTLV